MARRELGPVFRVLGGAVTVHTMDGCSDHWRLRVLSVRQLAPDPDQPRRLLPEDLREKLLRGASPVGVLWESWRRCVGDRLYQMVRSHAVEPKEALARRRAEGVRDLALQLTLEDMTALAESVQRRGLRHPIEVYRIDRDHHQIVRGERRWWAHLHLRYLLLRHEFSTIQAVVRSLPTDVGQAVLERQAEYVHRSDLSAIVRARALRKVEGMLFKESPEAAASSAGGLAHERKECTREMRRGDRWNKQLSRRLEELTGKGMSSRKIQRYMGLLTLPLEAQAVAEAADLSERSLLSVISLDDPTEQARLVRALALGDITPAEVKEEVERLLGEERATEERIACPVPQDLCPGFRFPDGELPDPSDLAAQMARLPVDEQARMHHAAHRLLVFLESFLEAGGGRP